jgi:hypothetical protein
MPIIRVYAKEFGFNGGFMSKNTPAKSDFGSDEITLIQNEVSRTGKWLLTSGIIAVTFFGIAELSSIVGFFLGIVGLANSTYSSPLSDVLVFVPMGLFGIIILALLIWLGASAIIAAVEGKKFTSDGSSASLISYLVKMRRMLTILGSLSILGVVMAVVLFIIGLVALLGTSFLSGI